MIIWISSTPTADQVNKTFLLAGISGVASLLLTAMVRAYSLRHEVLDRPNERSSHSTPTPRGGGLAVLVASALGMAIGVGLGLIEARDALTVGLGMLLLGTVGWLDDTRGVTWRVRLAVQVAIACSTLYMFGGLPAVRVGSATLELGAAGYIVGALGIVWSINLYNFMDGIDGLAGSQAVLIFGTATLLLLFRDDYSLGTIAAVLAAASAGFLPWNWPPAKIFLGDVGSGAIGYAVASLAIASESKRSVPLLAFAIIGGVFISDATVTLVRRLARGNKPTDAHREHAYQRLTRAWGSHRPVTLRAAGVTFLLACLGAVGTIAPRLLLPALLVTCVLLAGLLLAAERRAPM